MVAIDKDRHRPWLAYALEESLEHALLAPRDVIDHANPEVLVTQLPPAVISLLLSRALSIGTFSPAQVLESVPPAVLAEHLEPAIMWRCLEDAAARGGLSRKGGTRNQAAREWFASVLGRALESELVEPADVVRFLPPSEFAADAPRAVMVDLMKEALSRNSFDADLVLQHITPSVIAETLETSLVWDCIAEAAGRCFDLGQAAQAAQKRTSEPTPAKPAAASPVASTPAPVAAARSLPSPSASAVPLSMAAIPTPAAGTPVGERRQPGISDKTPAASFAGAPAVIAKALAGGSVSPRPEGTASRAPAAAPAHVLTAPAVRHEGGE